MYRPYCRQQRKQILPRGAKYSGCFIVSVDFTLQKIRLKNRRSADPAIKKNSAILR